MLLRITGAVLGGYAFSAAAVALGVALLMLGLARTEAVVLSSMLGFVFDLVVLLWAFSMHSLTRLWAALLVGTACCALAAIAFA